MAERKIVPNTVLLFLGTVSGTYDTVVCLTGITRDLKIAETTSNTFCGSDTAKGSISGTIAFEGVHLLDPDTGKISGHSLFTYCTGKTDLFWKISPATPVTDDVVETGEGFISSLSDSYKLDADAAFSVTITVKGTPVQAVTA